MGKHYCPFRITLVTDSAEWVLKYQTSQAAHEAMGLIRAALDDGDGRTSLTFLDDNRGLFIIRASSVDSAIMEHEDGNA